MKPLGKTPANSNSNSPQSVGGVGGSSQSVLKKAHQLRDAGQSLEALQVFSESHAALSQLAAPTLVDEKLWLEATAGAIETATQINQNQFAIKTLQESLPRFKSRNWKESRKSTGAVYRRMIQLAGDAGRPDHALDIYDSARQHLKLDNKLRRTLVDASVELDRYENLGTAYLCLNDLIDGDTREPEYFEKIIELIRKTVRIDLEHPANEDLTEHISLIEKVQSIGDYSWTYAYLALAEVRQQNFNKAASHVGNLKASEQAANETYGLAAIVHYELCQYEIAVEFLNSILAYDESENEFQDRSRWDFLLKLCQLVLLLNGNISSDSHQNHMKEIKSLVAELQKQLKETPWQLDAELVVVCAEILCGSGQTNLGKDWDQNQLLKVWMVPLLSEQFSKDKKYQESVISDRFSSLRNQFISSQLHVKSQLAHCELEKAKLEWQPSALSKDEHDPIRQQQQEVAKIIQFELQRHDPRENFDNHFEEFEKKPKHVDQLSLWRERLYFQHCLDHGQVKQASESSIEDEESLHPPLERKRLQVRQRIADSDSAGWDEQSRSEVRQQLSDLGESPTSLAIDRLHWCMWSIECNELLQAEKLLNELPAQLSDSVEVELAKASLSSAKEENENDSAEKRISLSKLSNRSRWENAPIFTSFRPWRLKVPQDRWHLQVDISVHRIADILHAADLQIAAGLLSDALKNLRLIEELAKTEKKQFKDLIGERIAIIALLQIPESPAEACRTYRWALECNSPIPEFCLELAKAVGDDVADIIFEVLVEDMSQSDSTRHASPVGEKVHHLTEITQDSPTEADIFEQRFSRAKHAVEKISNWDAVRRSYVWGLYRNHDHEAVVTESQSILKKTPEDHTLRGQSFWELNQLTEASEEFEAGNTPGWKGCSSAAAHLQRLWRKPENLKEADVIKILEQLNPDDCPTELAQRVQLWRGAILLAANRPLEAQPIFAETLKANELKEDEVSKVEFLLSLAMIRKGDLQAAEQSLLENHQESLMKELAWPLAEFSRLQSRRWGELSKSETVLDEHRKFGFDTAPAQLSRASLACRLGQIEVFQREMEQAIQWRHTQDDALLGPLALFLIDEERFLLARQQLQRKNFQEAERAFESISENRPWRLQTELWKSVCNSHLDPGSTDELKSIASEESPWAADAAAQMALFSLKTQNAEHAKNWANNALGIEEEHPFALAAQGQIAESKGDRTEAINFYRKIDSCESFTLPRALHVNILMAWGRLATISGDQETAFKCFVKATKVDPKHPEAAKRRAIQLAILASQDKQLKDAEQALIAAQKVAPENVLLALARVNVARITGDIDAMAARFEEMIAMRDFASFAPEVRQQLALHGVDIQFKLQRFGPAAEALQRLHEDNPSPEIQERLLNCRLLQAIQEIGLQPLPDNALTNVFNAATAVCDGGKVSPAAVLLKCITGVLTQQFDKAATEAATNELKGLELSGQPDLQEIQLIAGKLCGDKVLSEQFESSFAEESKSAVKEGVELLAANFSNETKPLRKELKRLIELNDESDKTIYSPEELLPAVLVTSGPRDAEEDCEFVIQWADRFKGIPENRNLCTTVLAKRAAFLLKKKELRSAMQFLRNAEHIHNGKKINLDQLQEETV